MDNASGFRNITAAELQNLVQQGGLRVLDVRTDSEITQGKILQGEPLPLHLVPMRLAGMDKYATTVFYCRSGGRSAQPAAFVAANGFADVYNPQGGITAWAQARLPISS